jgi:cytidylate kinase
MSQLPRTLLLILNLEAVQSASLSENIALRLFVGSLDAAKIFRETYMSSDLNEDGSRKKIPYTPKKRNDAYIGIENKASKDCIYKGGVEASLIWELKILKDVSEISLEDVPAYSSIRNCLKNKKSTKVTENDLVLERRHIKLK